MQINGVTMSGPLRSLDLVSVHKSKVNKNSCSLTVVQSGRLIGALFLEIITSN
jgi:hypothetical protein